MIHETAFIHPKAHIEGAEIGPRSRVWQFASVIRGTRLGADCNVASCATLDGPRFGDRCIISQGIAMGPGFWFGDDCFIGPNVVICNDAWPTTKKDGWDLKAFQDGFITVKCGNGVSIGANATVLPGVQIGNNAMIAAGATVDRDVPANYLFKRSGSIAPIDWTRLPNRMRPA